MRQLVYVGALVVFAACASFEAELTDPSADAGSASSTSTSTGSVGSSSTSTSGTLASSTSTSSGAADFGVFALVQKKEARGTSPLRIELDNGPPPQSRLVLAVATGAGAAPTIDGGGWAEVSQTDGASPGLFVYERETPAARSFIVRANSGPLVASLSEWTGMSANEGAVKTKGSGSSATVKPIVTKQALVLAFVATTGASLPTLGEPTPFKRVVAEASSNVGLGGAAYPAVDGGSVPAVTWTETAPWAAVAVTFPKQ
ncbi:MAG: hypothetical protein KIT84_13785 [Labilithrix sp.]|nr:hypothetical protein [Labilithrix sp.]MCW5812090.1 hypothetical protein [Labilithrix sp.]